MTAILNTSLDGNRAGYVARFRKGLSIWFAVVLLAWCAIVLSASCAYGQSNSAYERVRGILDKQQNGQSILEFVHFGADYHGHTFLHETSVNDKDGNDVPSERAVIYRYYWEDDGVTDIAFFYDARGNIVGSYIVKTNAGWSQPFVFANLSIKVVGRMVVNSDDKMSDADRKLALELIDRADAQGLLNLWLRIQ